MAVIVHHDGRREIIAYGPDDPDACTSLVSLSEPDTHTLAEILGVSHVAETVTAIRHGIDDMAIDWIQLSEKSSFAGTEIGAGEFRTRTGASIVAVIRDHVPVPAPTAEFVLAAGDVVIAVGPHEGLSELRTLLGG
jgi:TrkA domain protein